MSALYFFGDNVTPYTTESFQNCAYKLSRKGNQGQVNPKGPS